MKPSKITILVLFCLLPLACNKAPSRVGFNFHKDKDAVASGQDTDGDGLPDKGGSGGDGDGNPTAAGAELSLSTTAFPRLSHLQWDNSVRDVLLLDKSPDLSKNFSSDPSGSVFNNNSALLKVSANLWSDYRNAAETMAETIGANAELVKRLLPPDLPADPDQRGKAIVIPLLRRAFRRPPTADEVSKLVALYKNGSKFSSNKDSTAAGLEVVITAVLQAPAFLYRSEIGDGSGGEDVQLQPYELASRLSYAVWNSIPDEELLKAAEAGELLEPEGLKKQVLRLVADKKGEEALSFFHMKAFNAEKFTPGNKDKKLFPNWPGDLGDTFKKEAELFFREAVITKNGGLKEILTAPYAFVNDKTAALYGVQAPAGGGFTKVDLNPTQRAGLLTQVGFLASKAHENENDPIHRGTYMVGEIFCTTLAAPPVTGVVPPASDSLKTLRERVTALTTTEGSSCKSCHGPMINPAGFAFETFDATGAVRDMENGVKINAAAEYSFGSNGDGKISYNGPIEFVNAIVTKVTPHLCYVTKAAEMLYGRRPGKAEKALLQSLAQKSLKGASAKELFAEILLDPSILVRGNHEANK